MMRFVPQRILLQKLMPGLSDTANRPAPEHVTRSPAWGRKADGGVGGPSDQRSGLGPESRRASSLWACCTSFSCPRLVAALYQRANSAMKTILLGNAGSGKSTLSRRLIARHPAARLSLDEVAFQGGTERRPLQDSIHDVQQWIANNDSWVIAGNGVRSFLLPCWSKSQDLVS